MPETIRRFECPTCRTQYKVVRVEAPATHNTPVLCLGCGVPLRNREGKFALKYFSTTGRPRPNYHGGKKLI
jgi:RNase P subunit RPR2